MQFARTCTKVHENGFGQRQPFFAICFKEQCLTKLMCHECTHEYHPTCGPQIHLLKDLFADQQKLLLFKQNLEQQFKIGESFKSAQEGLQIELKKITEQYENDLKSVKEFLDDIKIIQEKNYSQINELQASRVVNFLTSNEELLSGFERCRTSIRLITSATETLKQHRHNENLRTLIQDQGLKDFYNEHNALNYLLMPDEYKQIRGEPYELIQQDQNLYYLGEMLNNSKHGRGMTINNQTNTIREGVWENDSQLWGQKCYRDNDMNYCMAFGSFKEMRLEGQGTLIQSNGCRYQGEFKNNNFQGYGTYITKHSTYQGYFIENMMFGFGQYCQDGDVYVGYFEDDEWAEGEIIRANGDKEVSGTWEHQQQ